MKEFPSSFDIGSIIHFVVEPFDRASSLQAGLLDQITTVFCTVEVCNLGNRMVLLLYLLLLPLLLCFAIGRALILVLFLPLLFLLLYVRSYTRFYTPLRLIPSRAKQLIIAPLLIQHVERWCCLNFEQAIFDFDFDSLQFVLTILMT